MMKYTLILSVIHFMKIFTAKGYSYVLVFIKIILFF